MNSRASKNLAHRLAAGIIGVGGDIINNFTDGVRRPTWDGEDADKKREEVLRKRDRRNYEKSKGY